MDMREGRIMRLPPRERILDAAEDLFFNLGIRRVTVEDVATKAETTKAAVYRHFGSKENLIAEWIRIVTAQYAAILDDLEKTYPGDPRAQLYGWAKHIADTLATTSHRGCPFINSIAELPDPNDPVRLLIEAHKKRQAQRVAVLCEGAGIPDPEAAAVEISFMLEGAQISTQNNSIPNAGQHVMRIISEILDRADRGKKKGSLKVLAKRAG
ncbi:AcrR family transcriptional regulator [Azospirillum lipoferum]|uniref:TetR/AcrR family transcriptional regulator n=1 Tax=Azospirillum lipoferum TaxID=193 RepID=A0A5A9GND3_AZOLI|nr:MULTISPECIES: TetR/AcrR family transcriptional regulator [Azospirillum]KAA0595968.1 TetR/AcrR family transcriptional regulator [Azospirillum lipoferum]MCP1610866.1 AcrR family transcriptional regulator [Azospirillum lipoferum]MDW5533986.1 TetR/AcrR family transcriptional regulator [Azospirillum sp. NL1]